MTKKKKKRERGKGNNNINCRTYYYYYRLGRRRAEHTIKVWKKTGPYGRVFFLICFYFLLLLFYDPPTTEDTVSRSLFRTIERLTSFTTITGAYYNIIYIIAHGQAYSWVINYSMNDRAFIAARLLSPRKLHNIIIIIGTRGMAQVSDTRRFCPRHLKRQSLGTRPVGLFSYWNRQSPILIETKPSVSDRILTNSRCTLREITAAIGVRQWFLIFLEWPNP